jgi:DNA-binding Lrp family transcriptional regulator
MEKKGIIEEHTTIINPQKISGAVSSSDEMEHFLHTVIDTLPGVISCNTILSRIKDIKGLRL